MDKTKLLVDSEWNYIVYPMEGEIKRRYDALRDLLRKKNIPVAIIEKVQDGNEIWFTGEPFAPGIQPGLCIFPLEGEPVITQGYSLVADGALTEEDKRTGHVMFNESVGKISYGDLRKYMGDNHRIGITYPDEMVYEVWKYLRDNLPEVDFVDITEDFQQLTATKGEKEIESYEYVVCQHEEVMNATKKMLRAGRLEREIVNEIRYEGLRRGVYGFNLLDNSHVELVSNPQGALLPDEDLLYPGRKLDNGDLITIRIQLIGCNAYYGSIGRCFILGDVNENTKIRYDDALRIQDFASSMLVPGRTLKEVEKEANRYTESLGYRKQKGQWLHSVGYYACNAPSVENGANIPITEGMIFSVHPSVTKEEKDQPLYCDDLYLVKKNETIRLTGMSRDLICL